MRIVLVGALLVSACTVGGGATPPPGGDDDDEHPDDAGPTNPNITRISESTTFSGLVPISTQTIIEAGVVVTVTAGASLDFTSFGKLTVDGTLDIQGTQAAPVTLRRDPADTVTPGNFWGGITVNGTGTLTMSYALHSKGSIVTLAGSNVTITDSKLAGASGDLLIMNGGTVTMTYSELGTIEAGDTTHCNMHFGGAGNTITVTNNNIIGTPYGLMLYGGTLANFQNNNWDESPASAAADWIDSQPGVSGDFSGGFFAAGLPTPKNGATFTIDNPSATRLTDAGPR